MQVTLDALAQMFFSARQIMSWLACCAKVSRAAYDCLARGLVLVHLQRYVDLGDA